MDSDQINVFTDSFNFEKNVFGFQFFLMYSDSEVQKLKGFGFGEIATSANILTFLYLSYDRYTVV